MLRFVGFWLLFVGFVCLLWWWVVCCGLTGCIVGCFFVVCLICLRLLLRFVWLVLFEFVY